MTHASPSAGGLSERLLHRLYGVAFLVVVALLVVLVVVLYNKTFKSVVRVKLETDHAGLQLLQRSDVKVRGLIVGEVRGIRVRGGGAELDLAIDSDKARLVPVNSQARLLPKTLFGEKYVDLQTPAQPGPPIRGGSVLQQDRSQAAVEIDKVLTDALPVLRAVQPEKLNATLNALATALQGRGDRIGNNLVQLDYLLTKVNPKLNNLVYDIRALADVSDVYSAAAPDLLRTLRNFNVTSQTIVDKKATIEQLIPAVTAVSDKADRFVGDNANKIIGVNIASLDALQVMATYSPELPCLFQGLMRFKPRVEAAVGGRNPMLNLTVEIVKPRPAYKYPIDKVDPQDVRNPRCYGLPNPTVPFPDYVLLDGTQNDVWWKTDGNQVAAAPTTPTTPTTPTGTGLLGNPAATGKGRAISSIFLQPGTGMSDQAMIKSVVAPLLRVPADQVPDGAELLYGPLVHGGVVTIQ